MKISFLDDAFSYSCKNVYEICLKVGIRKIANGIAIVDLSKPFFIAIIQRILVKYQNEYIEVKYGYYAIVNYKILQKFYVHYLTLVHKQLATQILRERHHELVCPNQYKVYYQNACNSYFRLCEKKTMKKCVIFFAES